MNEFEFDWERQQRTGLAEAVLCDGKTVSQIESILAAAGGRRLLLTRLAQDKVAALSDAQRQSLDYDPLSRTAFHGASCVSALDAPGIVCAGTSDLPVAREAARTLNFYGYKAPIIADVGVAGLWRLMRRLEEIRKFRVLIVAAGMEGALFSVVAGLVEAPIIAVPISVGYGVGAGGHTALHSALASCATGLVTVNIDNGFGAACAAIRVLKSAARAEAE